jgi:large repetitive protein
METNVYRIFLFFLLIITSAAFGQGNQTIKKRGEIIEPVFTPASPNTSVIMDPDRNGFVSATAAGFSPLETNTYWVPEFEIPMFGIPKLGGDVTGDNLGKSCGITDLIPDRDGYSVYATRVLVGGLDYLIFRFRVGDDNPSVEAWSILLDVDGRIGPSAGETTIGKNPGFELGFTLIKNPGNGGVLVYNLDDEGGCPNNSKKLITYPFYPHFQISVADQATCGDPDYFYDIYVPFQEVAVLFNQSTNNAYNLNSNTPLRYAAVTNISATCPFFGNIADISGVDFTEYQNNANGIVEAFIALIENQCGTPIVNLDAETGGGFDQDKVSKPTINDDPPIRAGQTVIAGTTVESDIWIKLYIYPNLGDANDPYWSKNESDAVFYEGPVNGTTWSFTVSPLNPYDSIVARTQLTQSSIPCGGAGGNNTSSTSVTIVEPNDKPIANPQDLTTPEDTALSIVLTGSDPDGDDITFSIVQGSGPLHGTLNGTGTNWTYTPSPNYFGSDSFQFITNDGIFDSDPATITITVQPVNDVPVANSQSITTPEDTPVAVVLTGSDFDGDPLTYSIVTPPAHGTLSGSIPNLTYTPDPDYYGPDSFTFVVNDGTVDSNVATVSINVTPVAEAPVADNQTVETDEDVSVEIILTGSDPDGDQITFIVVTQPSNGTLTGTAPSLTYVPNANYFGADSFTFKVNDGTDDSNIATVSITVHPVNDIPVANNQSVTTPEDTPVGIVLTATDVDLADVLVYSIVTPPQHGVLTGTLPNLTYTPDPNYFGSDSFTFKVNDGTVDSNIATVSITVTPVNDDPIAHDQNLTTPEDTQLLITLTGFDPDGQAVTFEIISLPSNGTLSGNAPNVTYTPGLNYNGFDSFTFRVNDGTTNSGIATITIDVTPVNDKPIANNLNVAFDFNTPKDFILTGSDIDGDPLTFIVATQPANGTLSGVAPNLTYTPNNGFSGTDSFTFYVNDGTEDSNIATVTLNVAPLDNTAPVAENSTVTTPEDTPVAITLLASDVDGDPLTYEIVTPPVHGTLSGTGANRTYSPNLNYNGPDSFTFRVKDDDDEYSNTATVSITVTPVNDAPVANNLTISTPEDAAVNFTLTGSDIEGSPLTFEILSQPANGTLTGSAPDLTYTPNANFNGQNSFTFRVNDGGLNSNIATVTINVTPVNDAPTASNSSVTTPEDTPVTIGLVANDLDGDALTYTITQQPAHGTLTGSGPSVVYSPALNYFGPDAFKFKVNDGTTDSQEEATVSITVTPVNDAPIANNQTATTEEDKPVGITLTGSDIEGDPLTFTVLTQPLRGTLTGTAPDLTYTPGPNYNGQDSFTFRVNDGAANSNIATVTITITPVNDPPIIGGGSTLNLSTPEDTPLPFCVTVQELDGDGIVIGEIVKLSDDNSTLDFDSGIGSQFCFLFTPEEEFNGESSWEVEICDNADPQLCSKVTVVIDVTPVNDAPVAVNDAATTDEDVAVTFNILTNDYDVDTTKDPDNKINPATVDLIPGTTAEDKTVTVSGKGIFTVTATGDVTFTPVLDFNGVVTILYTVKDFGGLVSNQAEIKVTVNAVNDPPKFDFLPTGTEAIDEDTFLEGFLPVAIDDSGLAPSLSFIHVEGVTGIWVDSEEFDGFYKFIPDVNQNGASIWIAQACDDENACSSVQFIIPVIPVNDEPVAVDDLLMAPARITSTINVLTNDLVIADPYQEFYFLPKMIDLFNAEISSKYDPYKALVFEDNKVLTITPVSGPSHGTANLLADGTIEYTPDAEYVGEDLIVYQLCDTYNYHQTFCTTGNLVIDVQPPTLKIYNGVSPNNDGKNDYWRIDGIDFEPYDKSKVQIFDRYNNLVWQTTNYKNESNSWSGQSNHGISKNQLPEGTYYYVINFGNGERYSGYVILKRE